MKKVVRKLRFRCEKLEIPFSRMKIVQLPKVYKSCIFYRGRSFELNRKLMKSRTFLIKPHELAIYHSVGGSEFESSQSLKS